MGIDAALKSLSESLTSSGSPQALARLNKKLNELRLGVELFLIESPFLQSRRGGTYLEDPEGRKAKYTPAWILGYGKLAGEGWCLAVQPVLLKCLEPPERPKPADVVSHGAAQSLATAPRRVRVAAAALLPELLERLREQVRTSVRSIQWARLVPKTLPLIAAEARSRGPKNRSKG